MPVHGVDSYIDLADFSPGIFSGYFSKTGQETEDTGTVIPVKDGALQENGTYGCCAGPNGGLIPLPRARAYLQDTFFHTLNASRDILPWAPSWVTTQDVTAPKRIPIVAAKVMPAFVGPARVAGDDIPTTEPLSHNPTVYWSVGDGTIVDISGNSHDFSLGGPFGLCASYIGDGAQSTPPGVPQLPLMTVGPDPMLTPGPTGISISVWMKRCFGNGNLIMGVNGGTLGPNVISFQVAFGSSSTVEAFGHTKNNSGGNDFDVTSGSIVTDLGWHLYTLTYTPGVSLVVSIDNAVAGTDSTPTGTSYFVTHGGFGVFDSYLTLRKYPGVEIFGFGMFDALSIGDIGGIYASQGPALADFTPGFVTGGSRPDLTSGDISFPGIVAVTYDFHNAVQGTVGWVERMIARLYKAYTVDAVDGPNVVSTYYDVHDSSDDVLGDHLYGYADYGITRSRNADPTVIGPPFLIILAAPTYGDGTKKEILAYPNPSSLSSNSKLQLKTGQLFGILCHQDRLAFLGHSTEEGVNLPFGDTAVMAAFERWGWFAVNDFQTLTNDLKTSFVSEIPFGYGCWISVNASEALLVKQVGGAVIIRNDLDSPTVVRLPGIPSTQQFYCKATNVPFGNIYGTGFIYGSIRGVWLWTGGDRADHLSPQLAGKHLVASDESVDDFLGLKGSHLYVDPFLFAPNSWVMDARSQSWWKLRPHPDIEQNYPIGFAPPSTWYETDTRSRVYAFPSYLNVGFADDAGIPPYGYNVFCQVYDMDFPESRWQARTQPLARTRGKELRFREVLCSASGHGTIRCSFVGITGNPETVQFRFDSDTPTMQRQTLGLAAQDVVVTILADSGDPDSPAPTLHRLSLGYREAQRIGSSS